MIQHANIFYYEKYFNDELLNLTTFSCTQIKVDLHSIMILYTEKRKVLHDIRWYELILALQMIMIIGLPGAGKTTLGENMRKSYPEKRYNIIGTDTLIDKMKVMGLPRKNNYHGRWEVLIDRATKALNKLFEIGKVEIYQDLYLCMYQIASFDQYYHDYIGWHFINVKFTNIF
jgi:ABC-type dipeptide/oligopeptide/nickel transport system ATPase component